MAWRIDEAVLRGEIDNRTRGHVTGKIWFVGLANPVELQLSGNCWRDLAGRRLEFTNPAPKFGDLDGLAPVQSGTVGDITASRKVRVPDIPLDQIADYQAANKPLPWHWGNCLYLEWYGESNGRIVIESAGYDLKIVGDAAWEMTPEQEEEQRRANGAAVTSFMEELSQAVAVPPKPAVGADEPAEWDGKPQTEEEAEKMQAESDRLVDRIHARLEREGDKADYGKIMDEELERMRKERGEPELTPEQEARNAEWIQEMNRAGQEAVNDLEASEDWDREHPLAAKAQEFALQVMNEAEDRGWLTDKVSEEHPVAALVDSLFKASVKLAGALNGEEWPPAIDFCAGKIVRLKKARGYLDDAGIALDSCREDRLIDNQWLGVIGTDVTDLAQETDALIAQLRAILDRGMD